MRIMLHFWFGLVLTAVSVFAEPLRKGDCIVHGHGPYPETKTSCIQQAKDQARTNCVLTQKSATVKFTFKQKKLQSGKCSAAPMGSGAAGECRVGECYLKP